MTTKYTIRQYQYREIVIEANSQDEAIDLAADADDDCWDYSDFSDDEVEEHE
jgi:hypothetical protein